MKITVNVQHVMIEQKQKQLRALSMGINKIKADAEHRFIEHDPGGKSRSV